MNKKTVKTINQLFTALVFYSFVACVSIFIFELYMIIGLPSHTAMWACLSVYFGFWYLRIMKVTE